MGAKPQEFAFDNERPRHEVFCGLSRWPTERSVTANFWRLSRTTATSAPNYGLQKHGSVCKTGPWRNNLLYWRQQPDGWYEYRLDGLYRLDKARPVVRQCV